MDVSSVKQKTYLGSKYWLLVLDEFTKMKWSFFLKAKSELPEKMILFLTKLQAKTGNPVKDVTVRYIRCDGAGENKALQEMCGKRQELAHINFEFTARNTRSRMELWRGVLQPFMAE